MKEVFWKFLHNARHHTWINGEGKIETGENQPEIYRYEEGEWSYEDRFFGGNAFLGGEVVCYQGIPIWGMNYHGYVHDDKEAESVYSFLKEALRTAQVGDLRGPKQYRVNDTAYYCDGTRDKERFDFQEAIYQTGKRLYTAHFHGGPIRP